MIKSSPWPKLLPPLAILLALVLLAAAAALWLAGGSSSGGDAAIGELIAASQAARADSRAALAGDAAAFDRLAAERADITRLRGGIGANEAASPSARELAASATWSVLDSELARIGDARPMLLELHAARERLLDVAPELLAATGNLMSALPPADLGTNQPYLDRFELAVESIQQSLRALGRGTSVDQSVQRLSDDAQYLDQIMRGLRGEDASLGMRPVSGQAAQANLDAAARLFEQTRTAIG